MAQYKESDFYQLPKTQGKKYKKPQTKEDWEGYFNKCFYEASENRKKHELQTAVNYSYYLGYQNLIFDPQTGFLSVAKDILSPIVINRISSYIDARHAKLTKNRPVTKVVASTTDLEDVNAAKYMDQAIGHLWYKTGIESTLDKLVLQMLVCGTSFIECLWDPQSGDKIVDLKTDGEDSLFVNEEGIETEETFMGEISTSPLSMFNVYPACDTISDIKDQPYIFKKTFLPIPKIEDMYPHLKDQVTPSDEFGNKSEYERLIERMGSPLFTGYQYTKNNSKQSGYSEALIRTMWIAPCGDYEQGVVATMVNNKLAQIGPFPNDYGTNKYPIVKFSEREDGFRFWAQPTLERLIPVQRAINTVKQKKVKNIALMAAGKWMNPQGSGVIEEAFTDEEGEVIQYNSAVPEPKQAQIASLPNYVQAMDEELKTDFRDVGGQRETTLNPGSNLTAGVAMQQAAELADETVGPVLRRYGRSLEVMAGIHALLIDQEYIEPRKIKIIGNNGKLAVQWMSNADFRHATDVHIEIESLYPDSRLQKRQDLVDFWDRRIITDPQEFMEAYRSGSFDHILEKKEILRDQIYLDIQRLKAGKEPEFNQYQNHMMYVKELTSWMNTPDFLRLVPERKQMAVMYTQMHLQALMGSMPNAGEPVEEQNQDAVGSPYGAITPQGA